MVGRLGGVARPLGYITGNVSPDLSLFQAQLESRKEANIFTQTKGEALLFNKRVLCYKLSKLTL